MDMTEQETGMLDTPGRRLEAEAAQVVVGGPLTYVRQGQTTPPLKPQERPRSTWQKLGGVIFGLSGVVWAVFGPIKFIGGIFAFTFAPPDDPAFVDRFLMETVPLTVAPPAIIWAVCFVKKRIARQRTS